jgi:hypothetical protein
MEAWTRPRLVRRACGVVGLLAWAFPGASSEVPTKPEQRSCVEYGGRLDATPVPHSKDVQPPSIIKLEYPDLAGTTPAHYSWPMRLDVLVDATGRVRRVCARKPDEGPLAVFGEAVSKSQFRPARLRGQSVAYETTVTIQFPGVETQG